MTYEYGNFERFLRLGTAVRQVLLILRQRHEACCVLSKGNWMSFHYNESKFETKQVLSLQFDLSSDACV